jgi:hypothetical protein
MNTAHNHASNYDEEGHPGHPTSLNHLQLGLTAGGRTALNCNQAEGHH